MKQSFARPDRAPDFSDAFSGPLVRKELTARELAALALSSTPSWFNTMSAARNRLAKLVGLKTSDELAGEKSSAFLLRLPILKDNAQCFSVGASDKHLDFAVTIEKSTDATVRLTTDIWYNHWLGRAYLLLVMPFHKAIVSHWVRVLGRNSNSENKGK